MTDWFDDIENDINLLEDLENMDLDLPVEKNAKKKVKTSKKPRLICNHFSEEIDDLVFYYEHPNKNYGRCLIKKTKNKKNEKCELCGNIIKESYHYYPVLWDRIIPHSFCSSCYLKSFQDFVDWDSPL